MGPRAWFKAVLGLTLVITCLLSPSWGSDPDLTYGPVLSWGPLRYADPNGFLLWMLGAHTYVMNTNNKDIHIIIFIIIFYVGLVVKAVSIVVSVWAVMLEGNARGASEIQKYRRAGKLHISAGLLGLISVCIYIGSCMVYEKFPWQTWCWPVYLSILAWCLVIYSGVKLIRSSQGIEYNPIFVIKKNRSSVNMWVV